MVRQIGLAVTLSLCACCGLSDEPEFTPPKLTVDLDGDGSPEKIETRFSGKKDEGQYFHLVVKDSNGNAIWTGPKALDPANELVFGAWDYGFSVPEVAGDVDGDGAVELIAPAPQSDVSPTSFRILRWSGSEFKAVRSAQLLERPSDSGKFPWKISDEYLGTWISEFLEVVGPGECKVKVVKYKGGEDVGEGVAVVMADPSGFHVKSWVKKMERSSGESSEPPAQEQDNQAVSPLPAGAIARYTCQFGDEDMRNSKGGRLTEISEILGQDRANYHRFKIRHRRDLDEESYFASANNRALFERVPVKLSPLTKQAIMQGNATVQVTAYPDRIEVTVAGE